MFWSPCIILEKQLLSVSIILQVKHNFTNCTLFKNIISVLSELTGILSENFWRMTSQLEITVRIYYLQYHPACLTIGSL